MKQKESIFSRECWKKSKKVLQIFIFPVNLAEKLNKPHHKHAENIRIFI
jgi:hypothetical protein